jgi:K+-sensing histidine kinase KdpD
MIKREYTDEIRDYRTKLAEALRENRKLKEKAEGNNLLKRMVNHELRAPLNGISGIIQLLEQDLYNTPEGKEELCNLGYKEIEKMLGITSLLSMDGTSKEEITKKYEKFSLEKIATNNAYTRNSHLIGEEIELDLKYNKVHQQEIKLYSNKGLIEAIWKTLTENAGNFAPKYTKIKQGIRLDEKGDLEIIMENKHEKNIPKRKFGGLGEGIGLDFVKKIIKKLDGKIEIYDKPLMNKTYNSCDKYGYLLENKNISDNYGTFAIKINIPKSEISENK